MNTKRNLSITFVAALAALSAITVGLIRPAHADLTGPKPPKPAVSLAPSRPTNVTSGLPGQF